MAQNGFREFWEEARRAADDGETVIVGSRLPLIEEGTVGWIAVEEKLPPNACPVLAWDADDEVPSCVVASYYFLTGRWSPSDARITHWQPLPLPPA